MQDYIIKTFKIFSILCVIVTLALVFVYCDREDLYTTAEKYIEEQNTASYDCDPSNEDDAQCCDGEAVDSLDCTCFSTDTYDGHCCHGENASSEDCCDPTNYDDGVCCTNSDGSEMSMNPTSSDCFAK